MNKDEFSTLIRQIDNGQPSFLRYFISCMDCMNCSYTSLNKKIFENKRYFCATGVLQALDAYVWPSTVTIPNGEGRSEEVENFADTSRILSDLRSGIRISLDRNRNVNSWTREILRWGMGARGNATQSFIDNHPDPVKYLKSIDVMANLDGDTDAIDDEIILKYNSGMSKIHSMSSTSGLIIYDSRVAFTIGECVNGWLGLTKRDTIPSHLSFMQAGRRTQNSKVICKPRQYSLAKNHPVEQRNNGKWLENQMRASWLFRIALEEHQVLWSDDPLHTRMHKLEAAFFMLGAYSNTLSLELA